MICELSALMFVFVWFFLSLIECVRIYCQYDFHVSFFFKRYFAHAINLMDDFDELMMVFFVCIGVNCNVSIQSPE